MKSANRAGQCITQAKLYRINRHLWSGSINLIKLSRILPEYITSQCSGRFPLPWIQFSCNWLSLEHRLSAEQFHCCKTIVILIRNFRMRGAINKRVLSFSILERFRYEPFVRAPSLSSSSALNQQPKADFSQVLQESFAEENASAKVLELSS